MTLVWRTFANNPFHANMCSYDCDLLPMNPAPTSTIVNNNNNSRGKRWGIVIKSKLSLRDKRLSAKRHSHLEENQGRGEYIIGFAYLKVHGAESMWDLPWRDTTWTLSLVQWKALYVANIRWVRVKWTDSLKTIFRVTSGWTLIP